MFVHTIHNLRRHFITLLLALLLAATASAAPVLLDERASTDLTPAAQACHGGSSGGC